MILFAMGVWAVVAGLLVWHGHRGFSTLSINLLYALLWPASLPATFIAGAVGAFDDDMEIEE